MTLTAPLAQLASECQSEGLTRKNAERMAAEIAAVFSVQHDEVGILRLEKDSLVFVHPAHLENVGRIPLNTSGAMAVRTFNSKRGEISNNFAHTRHTTFFEMISSGKAAAGPKDSKEKRIIQKMISCPVVCEEKSVGVIQICRKGSNPLDAGSDFSALDLQKLLGIATTLAVCFK
ncbi:MAG TPA: hypothetical protein VFK06_03995 [Candidatus Angelobacter sp.]|nr:hypothetical protein [Candidatus Angelobacter sp.]